MFNSEEEFDAEYKRVKEGKSKLSACQRDQVRTLWIEKELKKEVMANIKEKERKDKVNKMSDLMRKGVFNET